MDSNKHPAMTRQNPVMTDKMKEVLEDEQYRDPLLFTETIYREDGSLIPDPDNEKMTEEMYFAQFVDPAVAAQLASRLRKLEAMEKTELQDPLTERESVENLANTGGNSGLRSRLERGDSEWLHKYNWKTQPKRVD